MFMASEETLADQADVHPVCTCRTQGPYEAIGAETSVTTAPGPPSPDVISTVRLLAMTRSSFSIQVRPPALCGYLPTDGASWSVSCVADRQSSKLTSWVMPCCRMNAVALHARRRAVPQHVLPSLCCRRSVHQRALRGWGGIGRGLVPERDRTGGGQHRYKIPSHGSGGGVCPPPGAFSV